MNNATIISHTEFQARRAVREIEARSPPRPFFWQGAGLMVPVLIGMPKLNAPSAKTRRSR